MQYAPSEVFARTGSGDYMPTAIPLIDDFLHPKFMDFCEEINHPFQVHRKLWEFAFITEKLRVAGAIKPGSRGLCFGSGKEPLPALFAKQGCQVVATDAPVEVSDGQWGLSGQHALGIQDLLRLDILEEEIFRDRVSFQPCDMNHISDDLKDFDFCWSACCLEHLGSLRHGLDFIINSVEKTLKPGGFACHTTELNLSSNSDTLEEPGLSLYRKKDLEILANELTRMGHKVSNILIRQGASPVDHYVDVPPYEAGHHLKIMAGKYVTTSVGLIIKKGGAFGFKSMIRNLGFK